MKGTSNNGCLFIGNAGYDFPMPQVLRNQGILSPREFCEQHRIPFLVPFTARCGLSLVYDVGTHRLIQVTSTESWVSLQRI